MEATVHKNCTPHNGGVLDSAGRKVQNFSTPRSEGKRYGDQTAAATSVTETTEQIRKHSQSTYCVNVSERCGFLATSGTISSNRHSYGASPGAYQGTSSSTPTSAGCHIAVVSKDSPCCAGPTATFPIVFLLHDPRSPLRHRHRRPPRSRRRLQINTETPKHRRLQR